MGTFYRPTTLNEALALLSECGEKAAVVNGGTDIVIDISKKKIAPEAIIYVGAIEGFEVLSVGSEKVSIGGAVTYRQMLNCEEFQEYKGLVTAISGLGSPNIRNMGTPAGNICTAAPAADCATMLMAMGAEVVLANSEGERTVELKDMFLGRGKTQCGPKDLVKEITFSALEEGEGTGYFRAARRKAQDIGKVLAGVRVKVKDGKIEDAKFSLGSLNANIVRAYSLEEAVKGMECGEALEYVRTNFPEEAGLRESYFKEYKLAVTTAVIAKAFERALEDAEGRRTR